METVAEVGESERGTRCKAWCKRGSAGSITALDVVQDLRGPEKERESVPLQQDQGSGVSGLVFGV